ncbi:hypothetical protein L917_18963 [Phytophthora nicotianae]|uniref:Uncharacterized protein n=1 Tax=Phytophthora nicotianae TaxID=4792 RepID=W2K5W1_PHYNI|nr:hypothetical protein L916_19139 [Phytophthora nicotianae]ETL80546.1 hypothetical protein L917_18963 [Phytophthora nicotianae]
MSILASISVDGKHTMLDTTALSPITTLPVLTTNMKTCILERPTEDAAITPEALFGIICKKIPRLTLGGSPPLLSQVQSHTKKRRKAHKRDAVQPMIDLCSRYMLDNLKKRESYMEATVNMI